MITLYTWGTPNGRKISIMLEELDLPYQVHTVNIGQHEQFSPEFLAISPNNKIPALVDSDGPDGKPISVFESGAILIYLAEKTGKLLPKDGAARYEVLQWLMFQMGGFGPFLGQAHHFNRFAPEPVPYAQQRYNDEAKRLYRVLDRALSQRTFVAGEELSIADIALYPWAARHEWQNICLAEYPHVQRWFDTLSLRTAFQRGMAVPTP
ncbi:glutathione S-transferase N-terminal domain-containing protein [Crenobacter sp. SG2303]|uniref:Glutathione S-transferase N-terminal domain-containing protein n=1 Tax=Crenobacter oryzisoli TaxID=3056844 RepID=A0ABT7XLU4_9NEIS|nr:MULTISPECIES: glutathione binding-like protein [unclassified Crenobacter]MDN0074757.1 glutathione S-transferase N-terminal domain-containing protein [Crenobacter sp. SG2303]MDN0084159.1 glutathione S-transferase N-terminal domain-containing protein [Crenobacter sp. SG2305]